MATLRGVVVVRFPRALRRGDRVAVVSPASPLPEARREDLDRGLARLEQLGLRPVLGKNALATKGYLAGGDHARAADLQDAIGDPDVRAIFCVRGGYGVTRLLELLDFAPLARDPKPIVGYSDVTALLAAVWKEVGLVGFHGPMVATSKATAGGEQLDAQQHALLTQLKGAVDLPIPSGDTPHVIREGRAEGHLVGGNLSLVIALVGTPWEIDTKDAILFLEDTGEAPYRVDRMLTQLRSTGHLGRCAGVALGDFHIDDQGLCTLDPDMRRVFDDRLADLTCPVAFGLPFGHRPRSWTLPFGARARLDAHDRGAMAKLELLEPAVR